MCLSGLLRFMTLSYNMASCKIICFLNCWFIVDSTRYLNLPSLMVGKFYNPPPIHRDLAPQTHTGKTTMSIMPRTTLLVKKGTNLPKEEHHQFALVMLLNYERVFPEGTRCSTGRRLQKVLTDQTLLCIDLNRICLC